MKKIFLVFIATIILLSLSACRDKSNEKSDKKKDTNNTGIWDNWLNSNNSEKPKDNIETKRNITYASGYCNGLMFVQYDNLQDTTYCIDKNGNIVFTLNGNYSCVIGFYNDIAAVQELDSKEIFLCDITGSLTDAEDVGGTAYMLDSSVLSTNMFIDGYIPVKKTTTTYKGSFDYLGIIDPELNIITSYNAEFYLYFKNKIDKAKEYGYIIDYYSGCIFEIHGSQFYGYVSLRSGKYSLELPDMLSEIEVEYESDMWFTKKTSSSENFGIYDMFHYYTPRQLDADKHYGWYDPIISLSDYYNSLNGLEFNNGIAPAIFNVNDSNTGDAFFFTLIKANDEYDSISFYFEPVNLQCMSAIKVYESNEKYLIETEVYEGHLDKNKYFLFDTQGKIAEYNLNTGEIVPSLFSDDVIIVYDDGKYYPYTLDFKPLF